MRGREIIFSDFQCRAWCATPRAPAVIMNAARSGRAWTDGGRHMFGPQRHTLTCGLWAGSDFFYLAVCAALG